MKTSYDYVNETLQAMASIKDQIDTLVSLGICKKNVLSFRRVEIDSCYSMGEITEMYCGSTLIYRIDSTRHYTGTFRGKEKYATNTINLKPAQLKKYFELLSMDDNDESLKAFLTKILGDKVNVKKGSQYRLIVSKSTIWDKMKAQMSIYKELI